MTSLSNRTAQVIAVLPKRTPKSATQMLRLPRVLDDWLIGYAAAFGYRSVPELIVQTVRELRAQQSGTLRTDSHPDEPAPDTPSLPFEPLP